MGIDGRSPRAGEGTPDRSNHQRSSSHQVNPDSTPTVPIPRIYPRPEHDYRYRNIKDRATVIGIVVGAVGALIALLAWVWPQTPPGSTDSASVTVSDVSDPTVTEFVLPPDAPLESFPDETGSGCSEGQLRWLRERAVERVQLYEFSLRNVATSGAMASVTNIRADNLQIRPSEPGILFRCPDAGGGDVIRVELNLDGRGVAVAEDSGQRFVFNLEPGEEGTVELRLRGDNAYTANLRYDISTADATTSHNLPLGRNDSGYLERPGISATGGFVVEPKGGGIFYCISQSDASEFEDCNPADIRKRVAAPGD